ncbi:MAG: hypothetical protein JW818_19570 [Pirellulales bacterium]|nr:hypothetical protein [Pirellulales bacterium]
MPENQPTAAHLLDPELAQFLETCRERIVGASGEAAAAGEEVSIASARWADAILRLRLFQMLFERHWTVWFLGVVAPRTSPRDLMEHLTQTLATAEATANSQGAGPLSPAVLATVFDESLGLLLLAAEETATKLNKSNVGLEDFFAALLLTAGPVLGPVLDQHQLYYQDVVARMRSVLARLVLVDPRADTPRVLGNWWGEEVSGMPRRFGLSVLFLLTTLYAFLFAGMKMAGFPPKVLWTITIFITGVGLAQAVLFGGRQPRRASAWAGAVLLPVIGIVAAIWSSASSQTSSRSDLAGMIPALIFLGPFLGAGCGYMAGTLAAGAFCFIDWYHESRGTKDPDDTTESDEPA